MANWYLAQPRNIGQKMKTNCGENRGRGLNGVFSSLGASVEGKNLGSILLSS